MALSPRASAADYLCDLTQAEVESIFSCYQWSGTSEQGAPYIAKPFDCDNHGDVCDDVGSVRANAFVCNLWQDAANHVSTATLAMVARSDWKSKEEERFDASFPDGIDGPHPWWEDEYDDYCDSGHSQSDGDGKVTADEWFLGIGVPFWEDAEGDGSSSTYELNTDLACRNSPWNLVDCM